MTVFLGFTVDPMIAVALVLYMVGLAEPARIAVGALMAVGVTLSVLVLITPQTAPGVSRVDVNAGKAVGTAVVLLAAWAASWAIRAGRAYTAGLHEQAERRAEARVDQARRAIEEFARHPALPAEAWPGVTGREQEVLCLIGAGLSNGEIARQPQLTVATVKTHVGRLLMKLQARDRAQLVITAYEAGLAPAEEKRANLDERG